MNISPVNILILGQTGVGKSSLLNYLMNNQMVADTNTGYPVTAKGFHLLKGTINQLPIHAYDSWGIETGLFDEWMKSLKTFIKKSNQKIDSIWFCINSNSHRIQPTELDIINYLISKDFDVTIIFTKFSHNQIREVKELQLVIETEIPVIKTFVYVNSVEETLMSGYQIEAFGSTELNAQLTNLAAEKNIVFFKKVLKDALISLFENGEYKQGELRGYLFEILSRDDISFINELVTEESSWLVNARNKVKEKTSPLLKKVGSVNNLVKRSKFEEQSIVSNEIIEANIEKVLNDPAVEQRIMIVIKKELFEGLRDSHE